MWKGKEGGGPPGNWRKGETGCVKGMGHLNNGKDRKQQIMTKGHPGRTGGQEKR